MVPTQNVVGCFLPIFRYGGRVGIRRVEAGKLSLDSAPLLVRVKIESARGVERADEILQILRCIPVQPFNFWETHFFTTRNSLLERYQIRKFSGARN